MLRLTVLDQAHLGGGAAHVERDDRRRIGHPGVVRPRDRAGGGAGFDEVDRGVPSHAQGGDAAARQHHVQRGAEPHVRQLPLQSDDVPAHQRHHVGVRGRGAGALVLPDLGGHHGRDGEGKRGKRLGQDLPCAPLVHRVDVAVDEADRDGLHTHVDQCVRGRPQLRLVHRPQHVPVGVDPLVHREAPIARRQRLGFLQEQIVEVVAHLGADLQHVAESTGGDEPHPRTGPLDDGVGDQGGAVHHAVDAGDLDARVARDALHTLADRDARVGRAGELLAGEDQVTFLVDQHEIGEGATDVHAEPEPEPGLRILRFVIFFHDALPDTRTTSPRPPSASHWHPVARPVNLAIDPTTVIFARPNSSNASPARSCGPCRCRSPSAATPCCVCTRGSSSTWRG